MKITRYAFVLGGSVFFLLLVSPAAAYSQEISPTSYLFAEVKDTTGKALNGATVSVSGRSFETNENGVAESRFFSGMWGAVSFELQVSKPGYLMSEHIVYVHTYSYKSYYFKEEFPDGTDEVSRPSPPPLVVVLTRMPAAAAERKAVEAEEWKSRFLLAIKRGDVASVRALLQSGVSANTSDEKGVPAIAWAALTGNAETIRALLGAGADVRKKNSLARQALLIYLNDGLSMERNPPADKVSVERHEEIVRELVKAGADVNAQSPGRGTVIGSAISRTPQFAQPPYSLSAEAVRFLIAAGANVNSVGKDGQTSLMQAALLDSLEITKMLLGAGAQASVNAKDKQGRTALMYAPQYSSSNFDVAEALIAAGADVNAVDEEGQTALMHASQTGSIKIIGALLKAGASVNVKDKKGLTALMYAGKLRSANICIALIKAGASVNEKDAHGWTALMYAAPRYYNDSGWGAVKFLTAAGANVNETNEDGQTALMLAAQWSDVEVIMTLLAAGANVNLVDKKGRTARALAQDSSIVALLEAAEAKH